MQKIAQHNQKIMRNSFDDERKELRADPHMPVITHLSNRLLAYVDSDHSYDPADDRKTGQRRHYR